MTWKDHLFKAVLRDNWQGAKWGAYKLRKSWHEWWDNRQYWYSDKKLLELRNAYIGKTCVIVGNGPSLNRTKTSLLHNQYSFGMNRIYLGFDKLGFMPSFYVCVNKLVIEQCWKDIKNLTMPKFISSCCGIRSSKECDVVFLKTDKFSTTGPSFSLDPTTTIWEGATVTYVAMQLAHWMGFQKVILIGVDHSFVTQGEPHKAIVSQGEDPNHFDGGYFGQGFKWNLPDLETSELHYRIADHVYRSTGREIVDCTVDGKCPVFRKNDLLAEL